MTSAWFHEHSTLVLAPMAQGVLILGTQWSGSGDWMVVAVDPGTQQVVWQALAGEGFQSAPLSGHIAPRGDWLFVAHQGRLVGLETATGQVRWRAQLPGDLETNTERPKTAGALDELLIDLVDTPTGPRVAAATGTDMACLFDLATGSPVITAPADGITATVPGQGFLVGNDDDLMLFDGQGGQLWSRRVESAAVVGATILAIVEKNDEMRLCGLNPQTGKVAWKTPQPDLLDLDELPIWGNNAVVTLNTSDGHSLWWIDTQLVPPVVPRSGGFFSRLFGGGSAGVPLPAEGATVSAASLLLGDHLFLVMDQDGQQSLVVLAGPGLASVSAPISFGGGDLCLRGAEQTVVVRYEGPDGVHLCALGLDGGQRWDRQLPDAYDHFCMPGQLVVHLPRQVAILDPLTGESLWVFAN